MVTTPNPPGSPKIPPRQNGDDDAKVPRIGKDKLPWPVLMLFVLAVVGITRHIDHVDRQAREKQLCL